MMLAYDQLCRTWDPWAAMPLDYNLGVALTRGQVEQGHGGKPALLWANAAGRAAALTYAQLDTLSSQLASSLTRLGARRGDRVFLRLPTSDVFRAAADATLAGAVPRKPNAFKVELAKGTLVRALTELIARIL